MKQNLHMPTKFPKCIMNIFIQAHNTKFSQIQCPQNPSQDSSNSITNYQHCQNSISHQHCPSYTMNKNKHFKNAPNQHYNMINHTMPQIPTRTHNEMTMSHHQTFNETWNKIFPSKETKEKLTLMSIWEYGAWVLGCWRSPSSSCQSNVGSYFLPWKLRKDDPLEEEDILMKRKMGLKMGSIKNGCGKSAQKHKDLKKYWGRWMKEGWEA